MSKEESIKFINSIIDWKFLNFLKDRLLEYVDIGCDTIITISFVSNGTIGDVYTISGDRDKGYYNWNTSELKDRYKLLGLTYIVEIVNNGYHDVKNLKKYSESVSHKCKSISSVYMNRYLFIKPTLK